MTNHSLPPHYTPLSIDSQGSSEYILYYNSNASIDDIYECATRRIHAVINLLENLYDYNTPANNKALQAVSVVSSLLLSKAYTLLEELNPIALKLRNEQQEKHKAS